MHRRQPGAARTGVKRCLYGKQTQMSLRAALLVVLTAWADDAVTTDEASRCSACCSIVAELERNLEVEKPRMNVDLRRTLAGRDAGKVVDWATSELRTLELLEGSFQL